MSDSGDENALRRYMDYSDQFYGSFSDDDSDYDPSEELAFLQQDNQRSLGELLREYTSMPPLLPDWHRRSGGGDDCSEEEEEDSETNVDQMLSMSASLDDDEDASYEPALEASPSSRVGADFQAVVPDVQPRYRGPRPSAAVAFDYANCDQSKVDALLVAYDELLKLRKHPISRGNVSRLLTLYWEFGQNHQRTIDFLKNELEKYYPDHADYSDIQLAMYAFHPDRPWDKAEVSAFEAGLRVYGKSFHQIRTQLLPKRSLGEVLDFYYQFKTTALYSEIVAEAARSIEGEKSRRRAARDDDSNDDASSHSRSGAKVDVAACGGQQQPMDNENAGPYYDIDTSSNSLNGDKVVENTANDGGGDDDDDDEKLTEDIATSVGNANDAQ